MDYNKVAVLGAGAMGHGIAEVVALAGLSVRLMDTAPSALSRAKMLIGESLGKLAKSGRISPEAPQTVAARISYVSSIAEAVQDADIVIEAVPELVEVKRKVLTEASQYAPEGAIIASNTSNIRITELSKGTGKEASIVGLHFFNPPVIMKLVEVIRGEQTSQRAFDFAFEFVKKINKTPVKVERDSAGFLVNRITAPETLLFCLVYDIDSSQVQAIDAYFKTQGLPMGPYELMDYVGLDTVVHSLDYFSKELSPDYLKPAKIRDLVKNGNLGSKTGSGFYVWKEGKAQSAKVNPSESVSLLDSIALEVNEAVRLVEEGAASPPDIELAVKLGMNRPFGPVSASQGFSSAELRQRLESLSVKFGAKLFSPARSIAEGRLHEIMTGKPSPQNMSTSTPTPVAEPVGAGSTIPQSTEHILIDLPAPKVARLTFGDGRHNLLDSRLLDELERAMRELSQNQDVNVIIIRGKGSNFSAGAKLDQFITSGLQLSDLSRRGQAVFRAVSDAPKITLAQIGGYALGGGFELALACDIRVASEDSQMGFPELERGLLPGWGGSQRLPKLMGASRAMYHILSAERLNAKLALETGLISKIYPSGSIEEETIKLASDIAGKIAPVAAALTKKLISRWSNEPLELGLEAEAIALGVLYGTHDLKEGIAAFSQKRKPDFVGK